MQPETGLQLYSVDTGKRSDTMRFTKFPFRLYRDCPQWVPPMISDARMRLNRKKNPFYDVNDAAFWLAVRDGKDVGRICAIEPRYYNDFKGTKHAFFYLFDSIDDQSVANALFDKAAEWAKARGLDTLRGPLGFLAMDAFGLLAEGFDHRAALGVPYNHAYYVRLVEEWGFTCEERVLSGYLDITRMRNEIPERVLNLAEKVKQRYDFRIKTFKNKREAFRWAAPRMLDLYNRTLTHISGDPPVRQEEIDVVSRTLKQVANVKMVKFVVKDEELVGFVFCYPDISEGLRKAGGRLLPFGWWHILREFKRTDWVNINGMGIAPEYQGAGPTVLLYAELYHSVKPFTQYIHADVVQISEFNSKMLNDLGNFGVDFYKTHHIYRKEI
jgi:GNAT superfamily N-acetyltransferase